MDYIYPYLLQTNLHGPKNVRVIEVRQYYGTMLSIFSIFSGAYEYDNTARHAYGGK